MKTGNDRMIWVIFSNIYPLNYRFLWKKNRNTNQSVVINAESDIQRCKLPNHISMIKGNLEQHEYQRCRNNIILLIVNMRIWLAKKGCERTNYAETDNIKTQRKEMILSPTKRFPGSLHFLVFNYYLRSLIR